MTTGDKFLNYADKKLLTRTDFKEQIIEYVQKKAKEHAEMLHNGLGGVTGSGVELVYSDADDTIKIRTNFLKDRIMTQKGDVINWANSIVASEAFPFYNNLLTGFGASKVFVRREILPYGIQINPKTGFPEYEGYFEDVGEAAEPVSVVDKPNLICKI